MLRITLAWPCANALRQSELQKERELRQSDVQKERELRQLDLCLLDV